MPDQTKEEKLVVALGTGGDQPVPVVILGMTDAAWEYCAEGQTHLLDMTKLGIPCKLVLFGCRDHKNAAELINTLGVNAQSKSAMSPHVPNVGLGIQEGNVSMSSLKGSTALKG